LQSILLQKTCFTENNRWNTKMKLNSVYKLGAMFVYLICALFVLIAEIGFIRYGIRDYEFLFDMKYVNKFRT